MSQYQAIKAATNAYIKTNGRQEITGAILNAVMIATIDSLGKFYQFVVAENLARLERVRVDEFDIYFNDLFGIINSGCIFGAVLGVIFSGL